MSLQESTPNHFVPISLFEEKDNNTCENTSRLRNIFPKTTKTPPTFYGHSDRELPQGWEKRTFEFEGVSVPYHIARALKEYGVIACLSGLKPDHAISKEMVDAYKERGISVIWINYPNPGRETGYMPFYKRLSHYFYTSPDSPFHTEFPKGLARLLGGHSTGGQHLIDLVTSDETKNDYAQFKYAIPENTFLDNANAAKHDPFYKRIIFTSYALANYNKLPHETLLGLGYNNYYALKRKTNTNFQPDTYDTSDFDFSIAKFSYKSAFFLYLTAQTIKEKLGSWATESTPNTIQKLFNNHFIAAHNKIEEILFDADLPSPQRLDETRLPTEFETPTYGQILETRAPGRRLTKRIISNPAIELPCPMIMTLGNEDHFSSDLPQIKVAESLKVPYVMANAEHNSFREDPNAREDVLLRIEAAIPEIQRLPDSLLETETDASGDYYPPYSRVAMLKDALVRRFSVVTDLMRPVLSQRLLTRHTPSESAHTPS